MSVFYGLDTEAYDREYSDRQLLARIFKYFAPHRRRVLAIGALVAGFALVGAVQPIVISRGLDELVKSQRLDIIIGLTVIVLIIGLLNWVFSWLRRRFTVRVIGEVVQTLRYTAFHASVGHDMSFFDEFQSGRIISRITSDTEEFSQVVLLVTDLIGQVLQFLILTVALVIVSWQLTLAILGLAPVVFLLALGFRRVARYVTRKGFQAIAEVNAAIQEAVTGISVAKNFRQEAAIYERFSDVNRQSYGINLRRGFVLSNIFPVLNALAGLGTAALVYWGGISAIDGAISVGAWYLFIRSVDRFWFPMINISAFWSQFQAGLAAAERIFALIDAEPTVRQVEEHPVESLQGEIEFEHVNFQYTEQEEVLKDFNLRITPGESLALVGHTGAGKSSIAKLIARFYEFQEGRICIDGQDIRTFDLINYRRRLGIISQTPFLFSGTVADNIRYARPDLSQKEMERVTQSIGNGDWLAALPEGLQTDVGERGSRLSMGQRQLVALVRVLVQEPIIFVLDEAT
ncbi:MAG: ABC transporter ATP-binding protein, partial [Anaerolineae bacterium]